MNIMLAELCKEKKLELKFFRDCLKVPRKFEAPLTTTGNHFLTITNLYKTQLIFND